MAFTRNWDETTPTNSTVANLIDDYNRYLRVDLRERLAIDHDFDSSDSGASTQGTIGYHDRCTLKVRSAPTQAADTIMLYGKDHNGGAGNAAMLHAIDEDGNEVQITVQNAAGDGLKLNGAAVLAASIPAGSFAANAVVNADIADDAVDSDQIAAGAIDLAHMSANSVDSDQYVDGSIDAAHLSTALCALDGDNDSEGSAQIGDLIIKWGKRTLSADTGTITFAAAFTNKCFQVVATPGQDRATTQVVQVHTITAESFKYTTGTYSYVTPLRWIAIGR